MALIFQDFLEDEDGDLLIVNGDFVIGPCDMQDIHDILVAYPGWWKQYPQLGVGLMDYLESSGKEQELANKIITMLKSDGFTLNKPSITFDSAGKMVIQPNAQRT